MFSWLTDADKYLAAHPQLVTAVLTAGATLLAKFGFNVNSSDIAYVAVIVVAVISALASNSVARASKSAPKPAAK